MGTYRDGRDSFQESSIQGSLIIQRTEKNAPVYIHRLT